MIETKLIKDIPVFDGLSPEELASVVSICHLKKIEVGGKLFKAGDSRKSFYVILSGKIKIYRRQKDEEEIIAYMDKNNFVVESALVDPGLKHSHFGAAIENGEILEIKGSDFLSLIKNNLSLGNKIYGNIVNNLTERLHHANNKLVTVYSTGKIASTYANIYNILPLILETILTVIKAKKAFFALYKPFENKTVIQEAIGYGDNQTIKNLNLGLRLEPFLGKIFESGEDIFFTREQAKKNKEYKLPYLGENALGVKIKGAQKILGAIVLVDKKEGDFNFNNQILLNIISRQISTALQTAEKSEDQDSHEELKRVYIKPY
jgi:CRP-like cAMP-binding protein